MSQNDSNSFKSGVAFKNFRYCVFDTINDLKIRFWMSATLHLCPTVQCTSQTSFNVLGVWMRAARVHTSGEEERKHANNWIYTKWDPFYCDNESLGKTGLRPLLGSSSCPSLSSSPSFVFQILFFILYCLCFVQPVRMSDILMISSRVSCPCCLVLLICHVIVKNSPFHVRTRARVRLLTHPYSLSQTCTHIHTNGTVIKNETTDDFFFLPSFYSKDWGKSQRRSGEKSPPGNNEENDHLLFLKTRWGFTEVKLPFDVFNSFQLRGGISQPLAHTCTTHTKVLISTPRALLSKTKRTEQTSS